MGRETIIRVKDQKQVSRIVGVTRNLLLLGCFAGAVALAWHRTPDWKKHELRAMVGKTTPRDSVAEDVLANVEWTRYTGVPAPETPRVGVTMVYDIRDPAVLLELTGKLTKLSDNPLDALPYSRRWDIARAASFEEILRARGVRSGTTPQKPPREEPPPVVPPTPPERQPDNRPSDAPDPQEPPDDDGASNGFESLAGDDEGDPRMEESDFAPPEQVPEDARAAYISALTVIEDADASFRLFSTTKDNAKRNAALKHAMELYLEARNALYDWAEKYPSNSAISEAIRHAMRGRFDCSKLRTE